MHWLKLTVIILVIINIITGFYYENKGDIPRANWNLLSAILLILIWFVAK